MDNLYVTILMLAIGTINSISGWIVARLSRKVDELTERVHQTATSVAVLVAQLKAKNVINGEGKNV